MNLYVLDTNFNTITVHDIYESIIWVDRYNEYGDFELYSSISNEILDIFKIDNIIQIAESDHSMIIEKISIKSDADIGNKLIVTGRSLESILDRRIVWGMQFVKGGLADCISLLLRTNIIEPSDPSRKIPNFVIDIDKDIYDEINKIKIDSQYTGDNLYEVIKKLCLDNNIGFKLVLDNFYIKFSLYRGVDRSYEQNIRPYVVFSPYYENIINSNYITTNTKYKNVALVGGEGEGEERKYISYGSGIGIERRELFIDARDISSKIDNDNTLSIEEYNEKLIQRAREKMLENTKETSFDGETETNGMFTYGKDYFMGDEVQINDEYGNESKARVIEMIRCKNKQGFLTYPSFKILEKGDM